MQNTNDLTVLILAAGYGRRMGPFSRMINKCLVPYDNKPLISHIMGKFDTGTRFVIACGNMGQQVKDYVKNVHSEKNVIFVDIPNFSESDTGPATTIKHCAEHIQSGFLWISCDTLFEFNFSDKLDHNWIAVCPVDSTVSQDYCWIERDSDVITAIHNKVASPYAVDAFIGLMYVKDNQFINNLITNDAKEVYQGFDDLALKAYTVRMWQDFGTYEKWQLISADLPELSFPKPDEIFYKDNNKIIKFTTNELYASMRHERATLNPACMPANVTHCNNFLIYDYVPGDTLYSALSPELFSKFLSWAEVNIWVDAPALGDTFSSADTFYRKKTLDRLEKFRIKYNTWSDFPVVNGVNVKPINEYISEIDFAWLASQTEWRFIHGDMQFDNIIYNDTNDKFTAIDWRTDFAGDAYGDMYYDLAKMLGGLYLSYKYVKEDKFSYTENNNEVIIDIPAVNNVHLYVSQLREWVLDKGYDWDKVRTLVPLIYLNMAPLHEAPFDKFLIALAQLLFSQL